VFDLRRREFITLLGGAAAWPISARAQQPERVRRIGVLMGYPEGDPQAQANVIALRQGLREVGWTRGAMSRSFIVGLAAIQIRLAPLPKS
jgi:putative tryptophan/tyrosine transport system substrate-binding protein